ncbi:hypothetical protein FNQ90_17420 [Streptomyces alkaliphilus]|uniref:Lipoprotein n=1 Tax=Streptomyces alkaliphilus TaxID=1472722 RepID=A0A7W3TFJ4_9ACTN|nr:hypothetical protein [Streptomyces alkaliphilus]MBB0245837.1 hypothetical protein [Streptomyces alkaliphilus]
MKRRLAGSAVAGMVAASLLLTACSSDGEGDEGAAAPIEGADGAGEATSEPEPEETAEDPTPEDDDIDRPEIRLPEDLNLIFDKPEVEEADEAAVLVDAEWQVKSIYEVISYHDVEGSSVSFYTQGQALLENMEMLDRILERGITTSGEIRYYDYEVNILPGEAAVLTYCRDFTGSVTHDFSTREVVQEADPDALPTRYVARLEKGDQGVWQTVEEELERESSQCL